MNSILVDSASLNIHPLENEWALWFDSQQKKATQANWHDNLKLLINFNSVEEFWGVYNNVVKASALSTGSNLHLFKRDIRPMWEDPMNNDGGKWVATVSNKSDLDAFWLKTLLGCIGEMFTDYDEICGVVVSVRKSTNRISLWTKSCSDKEVIVRIGNEWKKLMEYTGNIGFQAHSEAISKDNSYKNEDKFLITFLVLHCIAVNPKHFAPRIKDAKILIQKAVSLPKLEIFKESNSKAPPKPIGNLATSLSELRLDSFTFGQLEYFKSFYSDTNNFQAPCFQPVTLSLSWLPGLRAALKPLGMHVYADTRDWTIHGLWPLSEIPLSETFEAETIKSQLSPETNEFLNQYMKNDKTTDNSRFLAHEYNKHGRYYRPIKSECDAVTPQDYFQDAINYYIKYDVARLFRIVKIVPNSSRILYSTKLVSMLIYHVFNTGVTLVCRDGYLIEIRLHIHGNPLENSDSPTCEDVFQYSE